MQHFLYFGLCSAWAKWLKDTVFHPILLLTPFFFNCLKLKTWTDTSRTTRSSVSLYNRKQLNQPFNSFALLQVPLLFWHMASGTAAQSLHILPWRRRWWLEVKKKQKKTQRNNKQKTLHAIEKVWNLLKCTANGFSICSSNSEQEEL